MAFLVENILMSMYPRNASNPLGEELILKGELEPTNEGYAIARLCEFQLFLVIYMIKNILICFQQ
jgi:GDP-L-fucose synthase